MDNDSVLVTGGTGFLGRYLVPALRDRGLAITVFARPASDATRLERAGIPVVRGSLTDQSDLARALGGHDKVVHLAAATDVTDPSVNWQTNVEGIRSLIAAGQEQGVRRVLFFSSTCAGRTHRDAYGETKLEGEKLFAESGLAVTTFRPTMIYGFGSREFATFVNAVRRLPIVPIIGRGTHWLQPVSIHDVIPAVVAALERDVAIGKTYDIAGPAHISMNDLARLTASVMGRRLLLHLPVRLCMLGAKLLGLLFRRPFLTVDQVLAFVQDTEVDISSAREDLGFAPRPIDQGLQEVLRDFPWWREPDGG